MAARYLSDVVGSDANNGTTKALAKSTMAGVISVMSAGDDLYVDSRHAQTISANTVFTFPGTITAPCKIYSIDWADVAEPPTTLLAGASLVGSSTAITVALAGYYFLHGFNVNAGLSLTIGATAGAGRHLWENCDLRVQGTGSTGQIITSGPTGGQFTQLKNCRYRFSGTANSFNFGHRTEILGGSFISGGSTPTALMNYGVSGRAGGASISGLDCTNLTSGFHWLAAASSGSGVVDVRNAKLPASWSGNAFSGTPSSPGLRFRMHNTDSTDTNNRFLEDEYAGQIRGDATVYRTRDYGAGVTPFSWRMASTANVSFPVMPLESPELPAKYNDVVGSPITATVDIVHDGASALTDGEVWLELQYLGTSGFPLSTFISDRKALLTAGTAQATSAAAWVGDTGTGPNGSATWNTLKLECTFTPQEPGYIQARVLLAKPSTVVYVDPLIQVA